VGGSQKMPSTNARCRFSIVGLGDREATQLIGWACKKVVALDLRFGTWA